MSLIEGLGDEVTFAFVLLTVILVAVIAWVSTHTREIPFISVIVVELSRRSEQDRRVGNSGDSSTPNESNIPEGEADATETNESVASENSLCDNTTQKASPIDDSASEVASGTEGSGVLENDDSVTTVTDHSCTVTDLLSTQGDVMGKTDGLNAITEIKGGNNISSDSVPGSRQVTEGSENSAGNNATECDTTDATRQHMESELRHRRLAFFDGSNRGSNSADDTSSSHTNKQSHGNSHSNSAAATSETSASAPSSCLSTPLGEAEVEGELPATDRVNLAEPGTGSARSCDASELSESGSEIRVRLKYLNDTQRLVYTRPSQTVQEFRRAHFASELANNKLVRFIFNGQDLRNDGYTLQSYNIVDNSVVHCLVTQTQQTPHVMPHDDDLDLDVGHLMLPLFGFILAVIWYLRFSYRQYFNAMSTLCLVGVTFLFFLGVVSSYNGHRRRVHVD
ncbi:transmembrane and ubiquitin-like domain-containing protein 1 [Gigantopelta aegis]|uniref:transmembrane and ubiquitin-like domain-containing protein 1 n=1 Tax=Gigantopelta aegis TaxID=1735272 RepID=UPI001B88DA4F|nr:transmembrane and ubiquitin-like domain-containing protein 1 [Gigantopelta aegis]XP_041371717.1 transmembrane and ubiquitin-like domain-containing protein 1 [Gigantopelta aegis]